MSNKSVPSKVFRYHSSLAGQDSLDAAGARRLSAAPQKFVFYFIPWYPSTSHHLLCLFSSFYLYFKHLSIPVQTFVSLEIKLPLKLRNLYFFGGLKTLVFPPCLCSCPLAASICPFVKQVQHSALIPVTSSRCCNEVTRPSHARLRQPVNVPDCLASPHGGELPWWKKVMNVEEKLKNQIPQFVYSAGKM